MTWTALGELPETYREALVLYYWEDQSAREVAAALEISEQAVQQRLSRGRSLLREEVLSRVEGALRRGRPGAAMTATIVAAVAMSSQNVASAATSTSVATASTPSAALPRMGIARKGALAIAGVVITLVVAFVIYTRGHTAFASTAETSSTATTVFTADPAARMESGAETGSVDRVSTPGQVPTPGAVPGPTSADDHGGDRDGQYVVIDVEAGLSASNEVRQAATRCFVNALTDAPALIRATIRDGRIASVSIAPESRAWNTPLALVDERGQELSATEVETWIVEDKNPITTNLPDGAVSVENFLSLCAGRRLVGLAANAPGDQITIRLSGTVVTPKRVDSEGYSDLGVGRGAAVGPADAKVTIVAFLALGDRFGRRLVDTLGAVRAKHPRDVRIVVNPTALRAGSEDLAGEAVLAAHAQGALWPMLDRVAGQRELTGDALTAIAQELGLDTARFRSELAQHTYRDDLELIQDQRTTLDITALPSSLVNGKRVHGAVPAEDFMLAVEDAIGR